jgi:hypothetical protein
MSLNHKYDCKKSFIREIKFTGNGGEINCNYHWVHVTLTLQTEPKFSKDKAVTNDITEIDFNGSIYPRGGESWENLDDKMDRKVQKIFDSVSEMGEPDSEDGRDKCISKQVIAKLEKLGFEITSDNFGIDKSFKDAFTGQVVAEVTEL